MRLFTLRKEVKKKVRKERKNMQEYRFPVNIEYNNYFTHTIKIYVKVLYALIISIHK